MPRIKEKKRANKFLLCELFVILCVRLILFFSRLQIKKITEESLWGVEFSLLKIILF